MFRVLLVSLLLTLQLQTKQDLAFLHFTQKNSVIPKMILVNLDALSLLIFDLTVTISVKDEALILFK